MDGKKFGQKKLSGLWFLLDKKKRDRVMNVCKKLGL